MKVAAAGDRVLSPWSLNWFQPVVRCVWSQPLLPCLSVSLPPSFHALLLCLCFFYVSVSPSLCPSVYTGLNVPTNCLPLCLSLCLSGLDSTHQVTNCLSVCLPVSPPPPLLSLRPWKTKSMVLSSRQNPSLNPQCIYNLTLDINITEQVREQTVLRVTIDQELKWQPHISNVCKQIARNWFLLGLLRKCVDTVSLGLFLNAHLLAHINYASTVWSNASEVHLKNKLKNSALSTVEQQNSSYLITPCQRRYKSVRGFKVNLRNVLVNKCNHVQGNLSV